MVGDALTTGPHVLTGASGPQPAPFTDDPSQALASLDRIEATGATWVLVGHGVPWSGGAAEVVRLVRLATADAA
jgi:glyoxylase-like metal-dependent hydrolase (beta-lactamase superfamily II)